jgi:FkbM family methyltransferase
MRSFYERLTSKVKRLVKEYPLEKQLSKIAKLPRYTQGEFNWSGKTFRFPDASSFAWTYEELFKRHIYRFESDAVAPVIIDCGANIGLSALYFKQLYPKARIIAFEPDEEIFGYLKANVETFGLADVELIKKGLWKEETVLEFFSEGSDANRIMNASEKQLVQENNLFTKTVVPTVKLSNFINETVDFLKIDIEGAETDVLLEVKEKLPLVKNIFIEYHSFVDQPQTLDQILSTLSASGFRYYMDVPLALSNRPFLNRGSFLSIDLLLNIYAYRLL